MVELTNSGIPHLHLPLACIIDHLGCRLLAMSCLPIDSNTLVYGSSDGGNSFHEDSSLAQKVMSQIGKNFNLKPHYFDNHLVFACVDLEIHLGKDGRLCFFF